VAPLRPRAREALLAALEDGWADPRRLHTEGRRARLLLDGAREALAAAVGARTEEVVLTSSHAAALHTGLLGALGGRRRAGDLVVHSAVEHSALLAAADFHRAAGGRATSVAVDRVGRVGAGAFTAALEVPGVAVAALQPANGEVGTTQPVAEVHERARALGVPLVVDAAGALGQVPVGPEWDVLTADPASWGGPGGLGLLLVRAGVRWRSPWPRDEAERGWAAGSPSVPLALAAAVSLQDALAGRAEADRRRRAAVDRLRTAVPATVPDVELVGDPVARLPHLLAFSCLFADGETLVAELDRQGFAVGSGSACTADTQRPSHVLAAMGVLTHGNVRVALPATTPGPQLEAEVERFLAVLPGVVTRLRAQLGTADL
jgi:cysteine desulfurase